MLDRKGVENVLHRLGETASTKLDLVLFGGCAMALRGIKVATKDIDAVLTNDCDHDLVRATFGDAGLVPVDGYYLPGAPLDPHTMFESKDAWFDLFLPGSLMGGLVWSKGFDARAGLRFEKKRITVRIADPTDIFLLKSVTGRWRADPTRDIPDLAALLDRNVIDWSSLQTEWREQFAEHSLNRSVINTAEEAVRLLQQDGYSIPWDPSKHTNPSS